MTILSLQAEAEATETATSAKQATEKILEKRAEDRKIAER